MTWMRVALVMLAATVAMAVSSGCGSADDTDPNQTPVVFVSIPPQAFLVERIGGGLVDVEVLVGPEQDPHNYDPTPRTVTELARATIYFRIGMPFEDRLVTRLKETEPDLEIIDLRRGVMMRPNDGHDHAGQDHAGHDHAGHDHADHDHAGHDHSAHDHAAHGHSADDHDHDHDHGEMDPHVWLDPKRVKTMARTVCDELSERMPGQADSFRQNLQELLADIDELDAEISKSLQPYRGRTFYVFHPAFGYFADSYGLKQVAVETGGKEPSPRHVQRLIERAKAEGVRVIFVQPQFATTAAATIAKSIDGAVVPIDPLARNYMENLRAVAEELRKALGGGGGRS